MNKKRFIVICAGILVIHLCLLVYYGMQKEGFHEDELYTYFTSAGYLSPYPNDGAFQEVSGHDLYRKFLVTDEHRFDFRTVADIQTHDVHPPLYYLTLNALMSFFPNQFNKWFGIALNAFYSLVSCCAIIFFILRLDRGRQRYMLAVIAGLSYAICPAMISNVMFTRMYAMSAMWTVLYADIFIELMNCQNISRRRFAILTLLGALVCYCSFLTHYFCLFMAFFLTLGYCIYILCRRRGIIRMLLYGASLTAAVALAVLTYPASLRHIFKGYRGEGAISSLFGFGFWDGIGLFGPILNKNFYAGLFKYILVGFVVSLAAAVFMLMKRGRLEVSIAAVTIALASCALSVYLLSRTSLFLGDSSSRYFYPVGALFIPLMAYCICKPWFSIGFPVKSGLPRQKTDGGVFRGAACIAAVFVVVFPSLAGLAQHNILFLFSGKENNIQFARENAQYPAVVFYNGDFKYRAWFIANELWSYEHVIYMDGNLEAFPESEIIKDAEKVIVYISGMEEWLMSLVAQYPKLDSYTLVDHDFVNGYFAIYELE